jgi:hypothetical protein
MPRPFIEFVQAQALPWSDGIPAGVRPGVSSKLLSVDGETGASSLLVRYPPGWTHDDSQRLDCDEELFVLDGDLRIGTTEHRPKTYAHLPAGYARGAMASSGGAVALTFFSGEPTSPSADGVECDEARLVEYVDALDGDWGSGFHPLFPPGAGRKFLRRDPYDGEETWVLGTMPLRNGRRPERHPVVEEMFLLSGELVGHVGVMQAGAYFWRPPEEWHGPFGSQTGNLMLFRTKGGPLSTTYTDHEVEFSWTPEHRPILPPELQPYSQPQPGCGCF